MFAKSYYFTDTVMCCRMLNSRTLDMAVAFDKHFLRLNTSRC